MVATIYGAEKDVYLVGTQQLYALGQKLETPDGSIFRFTEMAGTVGVANKLYQSSVAEANWEGTDATLVAGATSIPFADGGTTFAVDEAAGGTLHLEEVADLGTTYRVKSNTVTSGSVTTMQLEDGVTVLAAVTANGVTFIKNPWKDVLVVPSPETALVIGVARNIIAANGFGWMQSRGVATCLGNGVQVVGQLMVPSNAVDGATANKKTTGTATATTVTTVITHNSGSTPNGSEITINYLESPTTAVDTRSLGTFSATQFTITLKVDPSTNDLDLIWTLESLAAPIGICLEAGASAEFQPIFLTIE
ncbi:hypothetical protein LCGC14_1657210 [marine sediment metagenome]|uniref:Uncharacterized protein n=1 Tax=marine sediment metagenome TaxID=412755 RepID=A0A0F9IHJ2_9ZZZZ